MAPRPYSERSGEPLDLNPIGQDEPSFPIPIRDDTPSPVFGPPSPPLVQTIYDVHPVLPILSGEDGLPYDHTLPEFIRQVSGQPSLNDILAMTVRVFTEAASLQQMTHHIPNLKELNLEGSALTSLRDIGSDLNHLHILRVGRCHLVSLDGAIGLTNLRELHAPGNAITSAAPCSHLSHLRLLDISRNNLQDSRSLTFLSRCRNLSHLRIAGNPMLSQNGLKEYIRLTLPALEYLDDVAFTTEDSVGNQRDTAVGQIETTLTSPRVFERRESTSSTSGSSRISSASSATLSSSVEPDIEQLDISSDCSLSEEVGNTDSNESSISKLTSGQIVCGNLAVLRRRQSEAQSGSGTSSNAAALEVSRRWRAAYRRFREVNSTRWVQESESDNTAPTNVEEEWENQYNNEV